VSHVTIPRSSHMAKTQVEIITSVQRRRRWTLGEKERLVAASLEPGAVVSALAREAGIHPSQLYGWRRRLCARPGAAPDFSAVRIVGEPVAIGLPAPLGVIEIELAGGTRLRITGAVDAATVSAAVAALVTKDRRP
jgi:transposase